jgi:hypothetical protein
MPDITMCNDCEYYIDHNGKKKRLDVPPPNSIARAISILKMYKVGKI